MITDQALTAAAEARAAGVNARADRPRQRRSSEAPGSSARVLVHGCTLQLRDSDATSGALVFDGYASAYEVGYDMWDFWGPYTEIVDAGAGAKSLAQEGLDVPLVLQHQSLRRIARTTIPDGEVGSLRLSEDAHGLHVLAPNLDPADDDVAYIAPKLRSGLVDEMSFMFRITRGSWSPDYTEYRIHEYDIHRGDVAIVGYGANPYTHGELRNQPDLHAQLAAASDDQARAALAQLEERFAAVVTPRPLLESYQQYI